MTMTLSYDGTDNVVRIELSAITADIVLVQRSVTSDQGPWTVVDDEVLIVNGAATVDDPGFVFNSANFYQVLSEDPPTGAVLEEDSISPALTVACGGEPCAVDGGYAYDPLMQVCWAAEIHTPGLLLTEIAGDYASTPDNAALDIAGDIDLRADLSYLDWPAISDVQYLIAKWTAGQLSYGLRMSSTGVPALTWSVDGVNELSLEPDPDTWADDFQPQGAGRLALRATLDVDNGAAGHTATFLAAPTIAGPWTQIGDPVVVAGVTSIFVGTAVLEVGSTNGGTTDLADAGTIVHAVQVHAGFTGVVVADPDFIAQPAGTTTFTDDAGRVWTVHGDAQIIAPYVCDNLNTDWALTSINGWEIESQIITDPVWGMFDTQRPGRLSITTAQLGFAADLLGEDARKLLTRGRSGFILIFPSGQDAGRPFNVYPVRIANVHQRLALRTGSGAELIATLAVTAAPATSTLEAWDAL